MLVAVAIGGAATIFGIPYAVGGAEATADNWVGAIASVALLAGLPASFAAFAMAVAARIRHERWVLLWLPLSVFPALVAFLALGEAFWWE